jgi:hypothetical protein
VYADDGWEVPRLLAEMDDEHTTAFTNYETEMSEFVLRSRTIGPSTIKTLIPQTATQVWATANLMRTIPRLPGVVQRQLTSFMGGPARALESVTLKQYAQAL